MLRSAVELAEEGQMISDDDIIIVTHNLKGDITTSILTVGEGYCGRRGQGFISGAQSEREGKGGEGRARGVAAL